MRASWRAESSALCQAVDGTVQYPTAERDRQALCSGRNRGTRSRVAPTRIPKRCKWESGTRIACARSQPAWQRRTRVRLAFLVTTAAKLRALLSHSCVFDDYCISYQTRALVEIKDSTETSSTFATCQEKRSDHSSCSSVYRLLPLSKDITLPIYRHHLQCPCSPSETQIPVYSKAPAQAVHPSGTRRNNARSKRCPRKSRKCGNPAHHPQQGS